MTSLAYGRSSTGLATDLSLMLDYWLTMTGVTAMDELIRNLNRNADQLRNDWRATGSILSDWAHPAEATARIAAYLRSLSPEHHAAISRRARETATHYAWCLYDKPDEPMSIWVNEYKDPARWPSRYANSVHNHRYDFCTRILAGSYVHETYRISWEPATTTLTCAALKERREVELGAVLDVAAEIFHRIPSARAGTLTLLVKARPRFGHSFSYDPDTHTTEIHIPVEARIEQLIEALTNG
jgi:hypothetical protein